MALDVFLFLETIGKGEEDVTTRKLTVINDCTLLPHINAQCQMCAMCSVFHDFRGVATRLWCKFQSLLCASISQPIVQKKSGFVLFCGPKISSV